VFGKTGTTNDSTDAWFTGCVPSLRICMSSWMGYEYASCDVGKGVHIDGKCGGMHDVAGVRGQIFGGTLPARIFARALQLQKQIKHDRELQEAGVTVTSSPTPTKRAHVPVGPGTPSTAPSTRRTAVPTATASASPSPQPAPTSAPPVVLPPRPTPTATESPP
jgi:membrane peptidoglycan carboxypeptidase